MIKKNRILAIVLMFAMVMTACGASANNSDQVKTIDIDSNGDEISTETKEQGAAIEVDEGLLSVEITVPASMFEEGEVSEESIAKTLDEIGFKSYKINDDVSVTYTMSKKTRDKVLEEYKAAIDESIKGLLEGENAVASFKSIEYNNSMSKFDVTVDAEKYASFDSLYALAFYVAGAYYQLFDGVDNDSIDVKVNFIDGSTGEVIDSGSYREMAERMAD